MKSLLATSALALTVIAASPVMAQTGTDGAYAYQDAPRARVVVQRRIPGHSFNSGYDVYDPVDGHYISSDPDVAVRNDLRRDWPNRD